MGTDKQRVPAHRRGGRQGRSDGITSDAASRGKIQGMKGAIVRRNDDTTGIDERGRLDGATGGVSPQFPAGNAIQGM